MRYKIIINAINNDMCNEKCIFFQSAARMPVCCLFLVELKGSGDKAWRCEECQKLCDNAEEHYVEEGV